MIFCSLYQVNVFSKKWRELAFVHYIKKFTITRYTITRFGCISRFLGRQLFSEHKMLEILKIYTHINFFLKRLYSNIITHTHTVPRINRKIIMYVINNQFVYIFLFSVLRFLMDN